MPFGTIRMYTPRSRQRGMASIIAVVLLIAGVLYILGQTLGIVGTRSADTTQQLDSTAALAVAESGLERAQAIIGTAASAGTLSEGDCTGIATGAPFSMPRGTLTYGAFTVDTPGCNSAAGTPCGSCSVESTGTVNSASRSLKLIYNITQAYGTTGRGYTVTMVLKNIHTVPAMALFHLAWQRQGPGGNAEATICADCGNKWTVESSSGNPSAGAMGVTVPIAPLTYSQIVTQYLSKSRDYVEVGALFPATSSTMNTPAFVVGSYWDDDSGGGTGTKTVNNAGNVGEVNSGVVASASGTCVTSPTAGTQQTCNSWCYGGDTLVYGFAGRSDSVNNQVTGVTFNTSGSPAQNIPLNRVVHFPETDGSIVNASGTLYSEIWWAYNPDYMSSATAGGATNYPSSVKASAGTTIALSANMSNGDTLMPVGSMTANTQLCVGDTLGSAGNITGSAIAAVPGGGTCSSAAGNYTINPAATGNVNKNNTTPIASSLKLYGQGTTGAALVAGATNNALVNIVSGPDGSGNYTMSAARNIAPTYITQGAASSNTINVPTGSALPTVGTLLNVHSGTGGFAAGTKVSAVGASSFTVDTAIATPLAGAAVCGGTCAFFNNPSSTTAVTTFSVAASAGTSQWASGFTCFKGVDASKIAPVTSSTVKPGTWQETVQ